MSERQTHSRSFLNERTGALAIVLVMALMWALDKADFLTFVVVSLLSTTLLINLEIRRRLDTLRERKLYQEDIRQQKQNSLTSLRTEALNQLPTAIIFVNGRNMIVSANAAAQSLFNAELLGDDLFLYLRQPSFVELINTARQSSSLADGRITFRYTTSKERSFEITLAKIASDDSDNLDEPEFMLFFFEITSILRNEQMRVDFVANASHELRTPLSSLMGSIETLQGPAKDDPEGQTRFLTIMQRESERMVRLIDDLLSLSKIELSRHTRPETAINIRDTLRNALNTLINVGKERNVSFVLETDDDLPLVQADDDQIMQVLLNLLVNAAKYADADSTVHVSAEMGPGKQHVRVSILDKGPGISAEHLGRLTERFYRVDTARSRKMGGTGLGLAIVKHILLRHESQLDIRSTLGEGSCFSFRLPIAADTPRSVS